jgi:hypothetical protein
VGVRPLGPGAVLLYWGALVPGVGVEIEVPIPTLRFSSADWWVWSFNVGCQFMSQVLTREPTLIANVHSHDLAPSLRQSSTVVANPQMLFENLKAILLSDKPISASLQ